MKLVFASGKSVRVPMLGLVFWGGGIMCVLLCQ